MRFGIWTASGMRPNDFRIRFLPVKDCAIVIPWVRREGLPASVRHPASTLEPPVGGRTLERPRIVGASPRMVGGRRTMPRDITRESAVGMWIRGAVREPAQISPFASLGKP